MPRATQWVFAWLLSPLLLAACDGPAPAPDREGPATALEPVDAHASSTGSATAPGDLPAGSDAPAATDAAAAADATDGDRGPARLDGYGPLRFGMTPDEMSMAWGADLTGALPEAGPGGCYQMNPVGDDGPSDLVFMVDGGRFVRYGSSSDVLPAPGGGRRGMDEAALQARYGHALQPSPHAYVEGGKYLSLDTSGVAPTRLVFETDERGIVTSWRVGLSPQVDYVEGCS